MKLKKDTNCYSKTFTGYVEENFNWKMKLICAFKSFLISTDYYLKVNFISILYTSNTFCKKWLHVKDIVRCFV
jgi:hypothetical protein